MTIGMLIESMAGKAGALHGAEQTVPFVSRTGGTVEYFGEQLRAAGTTTTALSRSTAVRRAASCAPIFTSVSCTTACGI